MGQDSKRPRRKIWRLINSHFNERRQSVSDKGWFDIHDMSLLGSSLSVLNQWRHFYLKMGSGNS